MNETQYLWAPTKSHVYISPVLNPFHTQMPVPTEPLPIIHRALASLSPEHLHLSESHSGLSQAFQPHLHPESNQGCELLFAMLGIPVYGMLAVSYGQ